MNIDWDLLISVLTLLTTVYFTWQLVENDNNRAKAAEIEKNEAKEREIVNYCKMELIQSITSGSAGLYQIIGRQLAEKFPKHLGLILESVESILHQHGRTVSIDLPKFVETMNDYDSANKYNWSDALKKYKNRLVD